MTSQSLVFRTLLILASAALLACTPATEKKAQNSPESAALEQKSAKPAELADPSEESDNKGVSPKLLKPEALTAQAPDKFKVAVETTKGRLVFEIDRSLAPQGADRFYNLVVNDFFEDIALFRMVQGFVIQFGIHGSPLVSSAWRDARIEDDPVKASNTRGTLTFATSGPNSRTTQLFINLGDNAQLDRMGFSPFGKIVEGEEILDKVNFEYAERPNQGQIQAEGNRYLKQKFPNLDYILKMSLID